MSLCTPLGAISRRVGAPGRQPYAKTCLPFHRTSRVVRMAPTQVDSSLLARGFLSCSSIAGAGGVFFPECTSILRHGASTQPALAIGSLLGLLDQRRLPEGENRSQVRTVQAVADAISDMAARDAPAIVGLAGVWGIVLTAREGRCLQEARDLCASGIPTHSCESRLGPGPLSLSRFHESPRARGGSPAAGRGGAKTRPSAL